MIKAALATLSLRRELQAAQTNHTFPTDVPIATASDDLLRRVPYAERVAQILSEPIGTGGRVYAVRGEWGSGKSSLKNLVIEHFSASSAPPDWLEFNPWQWRNAEAISRAFYQEIADKLGSAHSSQAAKRAAKLRRYGAIINGAGAPINKLRENGALSAFLGNSAVIALVAWLGFDMPNAVYVGGGLAIAALLLQGTGWLLQVWGRDRSNEPLEAVRRDLENSLRTLDRPLVVFVDDIDRLDAEEIREVVRQVKANGNLPNIAFVLLFQPNIVEAALDSVADGDGRSFLEKIVQTSFDLPPIPASTVHKVMGAELDALASEYAIPENGFDDVRWGNVLIGCIQPYIRNLRDARRYLSSVRAHLPLQVGGSLEVNIIDFLALEALRVFEPALHGRLFFERELLLQTSRYDRDEQGAENRRQLEALIGSAREARRDVVLETIKELFPKTEGVLGNMHYGHDWEASWTTERRACSRRFFGRYFELQTADGEISESEFAHLLAATDDAKRLKEAVDRIRSQGLLTSLVARLDESVDRLPAENATILLPALFLLAEEVAPTANTGTFDTDWVHAWRATSWYIKKLPEQDRGRRVLAALTSTGALALAAMIIHLNDPADQDERKRARFETAFGPEDLASLKGEWLRQIASLAAEPAMLLSNPSLGSLLFSWKHYAGKFDAPREWVNRVSSDDRGFGAIACALMTHGFVQGVGDRVGRKKNSFNRQTIEAFLGVAKAKRRFLELELENLTDEQRHAVTILNQQVDGWLEEDNRPSQMLASSEVIDSDGLAG